MPAKRRPLLPILFPIIVVVGAVIYYVFDPTLPTQFFPKCPLHMLTGWQCPACGIQRAFHCLLHGQLAEALHYNYFLIIALPLLLLSMLGEWYNYHHLFDWAERIAHNRYVVWGYVALFFVWWVVRNLLGI